MGFGTFFVTALRRRASWLMCGLSPCPHLQNQFTQGPGGAVISLLLGWQSCPPHLWRLSLFRCMKYTDDLCFFVYHEILNVLSQKDTRC